MPGIRVDPFESRRLALWLRLQQYETASFPRNLAIHRFTTKWCTGNGENRGVISFGSFSVFTR